ncbi:MAG: hypothetical protein MUF49_19465 [Oculatellaceae cyanobacterium Prado106]|jgi:hypothetical protein|nr:hypothetical protein [Oculatellaceae cyanobacterium Prado106]
MTEIYFHIARVFLEPVILLKEKTGMTSESFEEMLTGGHPNSLGRTMDASIKKMDTSIKKTERRN